MNSRYGANAAFGRSQAARRKRLGFPEDLVQSFGNVPQLFGAVAPLRRQRTFAGLPQRCRSLESHRQRRPPKIPSIANADDMKLRQISAGTGPRR